ncbi:aldo/keto reductase [Roseomonas populi]|uniref:Aldo/keto reductase n=1 Tax=Roseomonas populi TaxID=3121582 RepID=A0ABT1XEK6_9PROT|nr:aldo/keto reductase [Roseomonas pecuniae]MCR0985577.1 aldo/keto reductase [Roseomonas pecuniae]
MEERNLGRSGLRVSAVGLGCNNIGGRCDWEASRAVVHAALDSGITLFDTANVYPRGDRGRSEEYLGKILGDRRKEIVLATKVGIPMDGGRLGGLSRRTVMASAEESLRRLGTDWIDLYQFHRFDPLTPVEETLRAMDDLVRQGKVRYIGCSRFAAWQVVDALWTSQVNGLNAFVSCQNEYSLLAREPDLGLLDAMAAKGLGMLPYFPLASGLLTGKYRRDAPLPGGARLSYTPELSGHFVTDHNWAVLERLERFCAARGRTLLELAFSWLLARPTVASVIAGATRPEQIAGNIAAAGWKPGPEDMADIDAITAPVRRAPAP